MLLNIYPMKKIVLVYLLLICGFASSQEDFTSSYSTQLIPNNPDVANLGKFGDIPINQYNGTANITVPIYNLNFDGLSIPISANYNTSGIPVAQEASWIGLGWSLNEGYSITREIQGFDDLNSQDGGNINKGWIYTDKYLDFYSEYSYQNIPYVIHPDMFEDLAQLYSLNIPPDLSLIHI